MVAILASAVANAVFGVVLLMILVGVVIGYYTRRGSGIDAHPASGTGDAPGSGNPSRRGSVTSGEQTLDTRGTRP